MSIIEDQLTEIKEIVYKNKETTDRLESNWDKDRKDFREFESRLGHLEVEFKALSEIISKIPNLTRDRLAEAVQPVVEEAQNLGEKIEKKRFKILREPWSWRKLFGKGGKK